MQFNYVIKLQKVKENKDLDCNTFCSNLKKNYF
jgi:hypothetical protein